MRSREEIEESFSEITVPAGTENVFKLLFEILLDIRESVKDSRERTVYEIVSNARKDEVKRRHEKIKENLKPSGGI